MSVLLGHKFYNPIVAFSQNEHAHATARLLSGWAEPLIFGGGAGVVLFFLVSGYIITHVLQREHTLEFAIKRFFRIYPLFIVAVLIEYALDLRHGVPRDPWNLFMQLTLMGDFVGTPGVLDMVDWTLRIEVVFYMFMTVLSAAKVMRADGRILAIIFLGATVALGKYGPFPKIGSFSIGYLNIYGPFLFLGAMVYLAETKRITYGVLFWFAVLVLSQHFTLVEWIQPHWIGAHFAILACLIFFAAWTARGFMGPSVLFAGVAELTFSVYVFHSWLYEVIVKRLERHDLMLLGRDADALVILFAFCFLMTRLIEKPGIRVGENLARMALRKRISVGHGAIDLQETRALRKAS
jgi:peptidoglycan/LPS O-acetylase OafA/YrhL